MTTSKTETPKVPAEKAHASAGPAPSDLDFVSPKEMKNAKPDEVKPKP